MSGPDSEPAMDQLDALREMLPAHQELLRGVDHPGHVASDLDPVVRAIAHVCSPGLARGDLFCEWGSGLGFATLAAATFGFRAHGIERHAELVDAARALAGDTGIEASFACGSFLLDDDEDPQGTRLAPAYDELGLAPAEIDLVFSYPWPGEELSCDEAFMRHTRPGALLLTFHDHDRVLLQRHEEGAAELVPLGWV